ncbi:SHOCT domain-containing protein [Kribbella sp. NPDC051936]|uniref:SHOCT domain-containing protein n=1 Tax=Kribbella sp. NPDC051936 TaxID=3154946 RepID=UPI0034391ECA
MSFWNVVWFIIISFAFVAYLMMLFWILTDIFRDRDTSGVVKAIWLVCLFFLPLLTSLVYVIVRGKSMADRQASRARDAQRDQETYIRNVAATATPTDQIERAKTMLDEGTISQTEFDTLKAKALAA